MLENTEYRRDIITHSSFLHLCENSEEIFHARFTGFDLYMSF